MEQHNFIQSLRAPRARFSAKCKSTGVTRYFNLKYLRRYTFNNELTLIETDINFVEIGNPFKIYTNEIVNKYVVSKIPTKFNVWTESQFLTGLAIYSTLELFLLDVKRIQDRGLQKYLKDLEKNANVETLCFTDRHHSYANILILNNMTILSGSQEHLHIINKIRNTDTVAYMRAKNNGWVGPMLKELGITLVYKLDDSLIADAAKKYTTRSEFRSKDATMYRHASKRKIIDLVCVHMGPAKTGTLSKWTDEELELEAKKYTTRTEFCKANSGAFSTAHRRGAKFMNKICAHMAIKKNAKKTPDEIKIEASKYTHIVDFRKKSPSTYQAARKISKEFLNEICKDMNKGRDLSIDYIKLEALKYNSKIDFLHGSRSAYNAAWYMSKEFLNEICSHMIITK